MTNVTSFYSFLQVPISCSWRAICINWLNDVMLLLEHMDVCLSGTRGTCSESTLQQMLFNKMIAPHAVSFIDMFMNFRRALLYKLCVLPRLILTVVSPFFLYYLWHICSSYEVFKALVQARMVFHQKWLVSYSRFSWVFRKIRSWVHFALL